MDQHTFAILRANSVVQAAMNILMPFALNGRAPRDEEWRPRLATLDKGLAVLVEQWIERALADAASVR